MDRIIENQLNSFCKKFGISDKTSIADKFEHFANYIYFLNCLPDAYSTEREAYKKVHTGQGGDWGIDGILITINDRAVFSLEEAKSMIERLGNLPLDVDFYFTQAKTSDNFDMGEMHKTRDGVKRFFGDVKPDNEKMAKFWQIQQYVYSQSIKFARNPICKIAFVTTGKWAANKDQVRFVQKVEEELTDTNLFSEVKWESIGAKAVQDYYKNLNTYIRKQIKFIKNTSLPNIPNVHQSHIGLVEGSDFIDLITFDNKLNKSIFYENVRAYLGDNYVNKEIAETLKDDNDRELFPLLNNGITIVARNTNLVGDNLTLVDFQIVNGCQTSNVLFSHRESVNGIMIPVKIISSEDQDVINKIIRSTNRQTPVNSEAFESIKDIHKKIQNYYDTYTLSDRIYYERRAREYDRNNGQNVKSVQVFTIPMQLMSHVAMFLDEPHLSNRDYYGKLLARHKSIVFQPTDNPIVYYTSARTLFKVEQAIHNLPSKKLRDAVKNYRFQFLTIIKLMFHNSKTKLPALNSHAMEKLCESILKIVEDPVLFSRLMSDAIDYLMIAIPKVTTKDVVDYEALTREILASPPAHFKVDRSQTKH